MRTQSGIDLGRLDRLDVEAVWAYLLARKWQELDFPDPCLRVFSAPADYGALTVPVPASRNLPDYASMLDRLIQVLSEVEKTSCEDLYQLLCYREVLKIRAVGPCTERASIPLSGGDTLIETARGLVMYSACSEISPQKHYRRALKQARELADSYELGQTEPGSYVMNVLLPVGVPALSEEGRVLDIDPLPRRVLRRIMRGVATVQRAVEDDNAKLIAENYATGFNANMCDLVANAIEQASVESLLFSAVGVQVYDDVECGQPVAVDRRAIPQLEEAAVLLKEAPVEQAVHVTGFVTLLRNQDSPKVEVQRHVMIDWEEKGIAVHLHLSSADYVVACDAHRDHKRVEADGVLFHDRGKFHLHSSLGFRVAGTDNRSLF